jgi:ankyrin repeat protein
MSPPSPASSSSSSTLTPEDLESSNDSIPKTSNYKSDDSSNDSDNNNNKSQSASNINESTNAETTAAPTSTPQINFDMAHFDRTLVVIVHFLVVVAESLKHCSPEETYKLKKLVYELIKLNPKNSKNSTLLHLASSRDSSSIIKNHTLSSFPSTEVLKLLLECGADPNSLDGERNSPLHLAAANRNSPLTSSSVTTLVTNNQNNANNNANAAVNIGGAAASAPSGGTLANNNIVLNSERDKLICLLLNAGTHLDACNIHGKTAADLYKGGNMYNVVNPINHLTLQCLAAKVIQKYKIPYREYLTSKLANFVSIH